MKRKLLFLERIMYGNGTEPFHGVFAIRLKGPLTAGLLRQALRRLQDKHPLLTAGIMEDSRGMPWFVTREKAPEIPLRVVERQGDADWIQASRTEWATPFDTRNGPLLRVTWLKGEAVSDLVLAFHHCMCDGGSGMSLLRDILQLLDQPGTDIGRVPAFRSVEELIPDTFLLSTANRLKTKTIGALVKAGLSLMSLFITTKHKRKIPRSEDYLLHWKLDRESTAALVQHCRQLQVTVNTALGVAFMSAWQAVKGDKAHGKITCPVDIRRYAPTIGKDTLFAFGLALSLSMPKEREPDFWSNVKKMQEQASAKMGRLNAYEFLLTFEHAHAAVRPMIKFLTYAKPGNDFMFSNMGLLDIPERYGAFEVDTVYSPTVIGPFGNPNTIITTTYKGRMDFSFVSNHTFLKQQEAEAIRDKAMQLLLESLPVLQSETI